MNRTENDRFSETRSATFLLLVAAAMTLTVACTGQFAQPTQRLDTLKHPATSEHQASDFQTTAAAPAKFCECVEYMRLKGVLPATAKGDAKDQGKNLEALGYKASTDGLPKVGDVAVYQKDYGNGINDKSGHIGSVTEISITKDKKGVVTGFKWRLRSSKFSGEQYTDAGCNNVSNRLMSTDISPSSTQAKRVKFYRK